MIHNENKQLYFKTLEKSINESIKSKSTEGSKNLDVPILLIDVQNAIEAITISNLDPKIKIKIRNQFKCSFCKAIKTCVSLDCFHNICKECYIEELKKYTGGSLIPACDIKCMKCPNVIIKYENVSSICPLLILENIKKENALKTLLFKCAVCLTLHNRAKVPFVELFCGHTYCLESLKIPIMTKIFNLNKQDKLIKCLWCKSENALEDDKSIINKFIFLKYVVEPDTFKMIQEAYFKLYNNEDENTVSYSCFYCKKYSVIIPKNLTSIECPFCKIKSCPFCGSKNIHEGFTCKQFENITKDQKEFEEKMKKMGICTCPHCGSIVKKVSGDQIIYCYCGKIFCSICERKLIEEYHFSHFYGATYGLRCKGVDNIPDI